MAADYAVTPIPTAPPPPAPPPPRLPPPPPAPRDEAQAAPEVTEVTVTARRVLFVDPPRKGTVEWTVGLTAIPDRGQPASASLDRLAAAAQAKLEQYLAQAEAGEVQH